MRDVLVQPENNVFIQHVGREHSNHLRATVENRIATDEVLAMLPEVLERDRLRLRLSQAFPDGHCNCWGVVTKMKTLLFDRMKVGDVLMISPTFSPNDLDGNGIEYIGLIEAVGPAVGSGELSKYLWGDASYPYIVFFSAIPGFRSWRDFFRDVGYQETKVFRGELARISSTRVPGGARAYFDLLTSPDGGFSTFGAPGGESVRGLMGLVFDVDVHGAPEGRRRLEIHLVRERNRAVVRRKKKSVSDLSCEVCGFSFERVYGSAAADYCEVHHLVPLSKVEETTETRLEDLAIVCSNCHRVIHLGPPYELDEVRRMLKARISARE